MKNYKLAMLIFVITGLMFSLGIPVEGRTWTTPSAILSYDESTLFGCGYYCPTFGTNWNIAQKNNLRYIVFQSNPAYDNVDDNLYGYFLHIYIKASNSSGGYSTLSAGYGMRPTVASDNNDRSYYTWVAQDTVVRFASYYNGWVVNPKTVFYSPNTSVIASSIASNENGSQLYLLYTLSDSDTKMLALSGSNDHGTTWNSPSHRVIYTMQDGCNIQDLWTFYGYHASVVVDNHNIGHVAFTIGGNGDPIIKPVYYCTVSSNGLITNPTLVSDSITKCINPTIAVTTGSNQQVYVAWLQLDANTTTIYCKNVTSSSLFQLSGSDSTHYGSDKSGPSMAIDSNGEVNIVWSEWSVYYPSVSGLYYSRNFNIESCPFYSSQTTVLSPSVCCDNSNNLHLKFIGSIPYQPLNMYYMEAYPSWNNSIGDFSSEGEYSSFAYGAMESLPVSTTSWDTTFQGRSCLKIAYSSQSSGVKITSFSKFTTSSADQWYRLRLVYYRDTSCSLLNLTPTVLLYDTPSTYNIKQIGGSFTGESRILPGNWIQFDSYVKCKNTVGQIQLKVKNNGTSGNVYIDTIDLTPATPPAIDSTVNVTISQGDFNVAADTTGWAFQPGSSSNAPTVFWDSSNQRLGLTFSNQSQTMKMTCLNSYNIVTGRNAVMSFTVYVSKPGSQTNDVHCYGYLHADGFTWPYDIGTNTIVSDLPTNQTYTMTASLSSQNNVTNVRLPQILLKNNSDSNITIYIDDIQLKYATY